MEAEQNHEQFKGWWIPADVVDLFIAKKLNSKEMILLATIDSLVGRKGVGCYATNRWLAERIQIKDVKMIQTMIAKFKRMKLVRQIKYDGKHRYLETVWSRVRVGGKNTPEAGG